MATNAWGLEQRASEVAPPVTAAELYRRNAEVNPRGLAVADSREALDWAGANALSDAIALGLLEAGLQRGDVLLVQSYGCVDLLLARLALEKAGLRCLVAPSTFREREIGAAIRQARPVGTIMPLEFRGFSYEAMLQQLGDEAAGLRWHWAIGEGNAAWPALRALASTPVGPEERVFLERQAFRWGERPVIETTSGSTGLPKCVEKAMYARVLTGWEQARLFGLRAGDVLCSLLGLLTGPPDCMAYRVGPHFGCPLILVEHFDVATAIEALARHRATMAILVPTMLVRLVRDAAFSRETLPDLRLIFCAGEALPIEAARQAEAQTNARLVGAYGANDFGGITATPVEASQEERLQTVGRLLRGNELRIVDQAGNELPRGAIGELWVRGLHASGSYYRNTELNRRSWRGGFYHTGDLGKIDERGNVVLTGRVSDIIIRGGQNIAAPDVEEVLRLHEVVLDAAVIGLPDPEVGERMCAFLVVRPGTTVGIEDLRQFFAARGVARFKCPERVELIEALPMAPTGTKVDKEALRRRASRTP